MFKPLLATDADLEKLCFPVLASPKLDGIRAVVRDGVVYSRSNKPIPNKNIQAKFSEYDWFDGELIYGNPNAADVFRETTSRVMSHDALAVDVRFFVFDHVQVPGDTYWHRYMRIMDTSLGKDVERLPQKHIPNLEALLNFESKTVDAGFEGLILRSTDGHYKYGRSTMKEGLLLKLKRFVDSEATIVDCFEREHNGNEATISELGRTKRSSHKAGKSGRGDLGGFVLRNAEGVEFSCGTGFTDSERADYWAIRTELVGKIAKFKYFPVGVKLAPRHPVWLGFRDPLDL